MLVTLCKFDQLLKPLSVIVSAAPCGNWVRYALPANATAVFVAGGVSAGGVAVLPFLQESISIQNMAALINEKVLFVIILNGSFVISLMQ